MDPNQIIQCTQADLNALQREAEARGVQKALAPIKSVNATGYFSTVRFAGTVVSAAGVSTLTITRGKRVAFAYALGGDMAIAGRPGAIATLRETNLSEAKKTRDGETYLVGGMALHPGSENDGILEKLVWNRVSMEMVLNTNVNVPLGYLGFFPAVGGLNGKASAQTIPPALSSAGPTEVATTGNGGTMDPLCYFPFPDESPIIWRPAGNTDSSLVVNFDLQSDIVISAANRAAAPGVAEWAIPATGSPFTFVDITVRLVGRSIAAPSQNQLRAVARPGNQPT